MMKPWKFWVCYAVALVALATAGLAQGYKRHFHIHQTSLISAVVTCDNGAQPQGKATAEGLEVSCGVAK